MAIYTAKESLRQLSVALNNLVAAVHQSGATVPILKIGSVAQAFEQAGEAQNYHQNYMLTGDRDELKE